MYEQMTIYFTMYEQVSHSQMRGLFLNDRSCQGKWPNARQFGYKNLVTLWDVQKSVYEVWPAQKEAALPQQHPFI